MQSAIGYKIGFVLKHSLNLYPVLVLVPDSLQNQKKSDYLIIPFFLQEPVLINS